MTSATVDPKRCPLCKAENACGMAAGAKSCWCFSQDIPPAVLDRIPAEARLRACVCQGCASQGSQPAEPPAASEELAERS